MNQEDLLLIAGAEDRDAELVAAAAARRPSHVTVLIEAREDPTWGWSDTRAARARRNRLAKLLTAVERATGATVIGLVGDPARFASGRFDAVVGGHGLLSAA